MLTKRAGRRPARAAVLLLVAFLIAGFSSACGRAADRDTGAGPASSVPTGAPTTTPPPTAGATVTGTPRPMPVPPLTAPTSTAGTPGTPGPATSAAAGLARYFAAAQADDARIRAAAKAINQDIGPVTIRFRPSTIAAVNAAVPRQARKALPAGPQQALLRPLLLVYNDLVARAAAFNAVRGMGTTAHARSDPASTQMLAALAGGSTVARRYPGDLAAARAAAAASRPFRAARADSRAAAELAVRMTYIEGWNNCCGGVGGIVLTQYPRVVWKAFSLGSERWDGTINDVAFRARYTRDGWEARLNAG